MNDCPSITVVIPTRNRCDELREALSSAIGQDVAHEILVLDDGSTDGTFEMVKSEFPSVRVERSEISIGPSAQRNRAAELARAPVILTIDDDAVFCSRRTGSQTLDEFRNPRVGAVAIPYIDVKYSPAIRQMAPEEGTFACSTFRATAYAIRKDVFLEAGGYRSDLIRQGEEDDLSIRILDKGYSIVLGHADPIEHRESPKRKNELIIFYLARNGTLFAWHNAPAIFLPIHIFANQVRCLVYGAQHGYLIATIKGIFASYAYMLKNVKGREPVAMKTYLRFRRLRKRGPLRLSPIVD